MKVIVKEYKRDGWTRGYVWEIKDVASGLRVATCGQNRFGNEDEAKNEAELVLKALKPYEASGGSSDQYTTKLRTFSDDVLIDEFDDLMREATASSYDIELVGKELIRRFQILRETLKKSE